MEKYHSHLYYDLKRNQRKIRLERRASYIIGVSTIILAVLLTADVITNIITLSHGCY